MTVPNGTDADEFPTSQVRTRAEAEAYVASVCFKHGPPRLLGVELEWTVHHADDPRGPLDAELLTDALGSHAPRSLVADSPHRRLPAGSIVTVEPGGQVEISSDPTTGLAALLRAVDADADYLRERLAQHRLMLGENGIDPWRPPRRLVRIPRYAAMEAAFDRIGLDGRLMMCSTAGIQVCLDAGETHRVASRWAALHALGPVMIAMFGNSPQLFGEHTGWASTRTRVLLRTDPPRTRPGPVGGNPARGWARRILDATLVCLRRDGEDWRAPEGVSFADWISGALPRPPTSSDLEYHLTTMFPPVRPRGYFEVRYLDARAGREWMLPVAALVVLFQQESTVDEVLELTSEVADRWMPAAQRGLDDPPLARAAQAVFDLACRRLERAGDACGLSGWLAEFVGKRLAAVS